MLKILVKNRMASLLGYLTGAGRSRSKSNSSNRNLKALGFGLLMLYCLGTFTYLFCMMFSQLAGAFHQIGIDWLYFTMAFIMAFTLMFVGSVFTAKAQLYESKDNELLFSLPIKPGDILASRLIMLLVLNALFDLIVMVPAGIIYFKAVPIQALPLLFFITLCLLLPFFSVAISGIFGWVLAMISARIRRKSLFTTLFSVLFLLAYFYVCGNANRFISGFIASSAFIANALDFPNPLLWIGVAIAHGDVPAFLLSLIILSVPFFLVYLVLSKTFSKVATTNRGFVKIKYQEKALQVAAPETAVFQKNLSHLLSSSGYLLNSAIGALMAIGLAVFLLIKPETITNVLALSPTFKNMAVPASLAALCFLSSTIMLTAPSISIEGKNLWIEKSIPLSSAAILRQKLKLHLVIALPSIAIAAAVTIYVIKPTILSSVLIFAVSLLFTYFCALLGLIANLKHPKLDYISETYAVKQSFSVMLTMLVSMGVGLLIAALCIALVHLGLIPEIPLGICGTLLAAAGILMRRWLYRVGVSVYESL